MATSNVDTKAAEAYESSLVPGIFGPWAEAIVAAAGLEQGMTVLDIACGTGVAARYAAPLCGSEGKVIGVDIDPGMIEIARSASRGSGAGLEFRCASAEALPVGPQSVDVALCLQGLQFFPDRQKALVEILRVLKAGGTLVATTWGEIEACKGYWAVVSALEARGIDATAARKPFSMADPQSLRGCAEEAGFSKVDVSTESRLAEFSSAAAFVDAIASGAPSSRFALAKVAPEEWQDYLGEVESRLAPWKTPSGLAFPMASNVMRARK